MRVLITVKTYPMPSRRHGELVCTAGVLENGSWIRIYPVPFKFLEDHKYQKYQWIELDLVRHPPGQDFRSESHRPRAYDLSDMRVVGQIGTEQHWYKRKLACLKKVYADMTSLVADSNAPGNVSLAAFRPARIKRFIVDDDDPEWKPEWLDQLKQMDMLTGDPAKPHVPIDKIPYRFKYEFEDETGRSSTMSIEDWEIGALYRKCLDRACGDKDAAIAKVRQKYEREFRTQKDITLFLGTTLEHHVKRHPNPFTIIGVFYPPRDAQQHLF